MADVAPPPAAHHHDLETDLATREDLVQNVFGTGSHKKALGDAGLWFMGVLASSLLLYHVLFLVSGSRSAHLKGGKRWLLWIFSAIWLLALLPITGHYSRKMPAILASGWWVLMGSGTVIKALMCLTEFVYYISGVFKPESLPVGATLGPVLALLRLTRKQAPASLAKVEEMTEEDAKGMPKKGQKAAADAAVKPETPSPAPLERPSTLSEKVWAALKPQHLAQDPSLVVIFLPTVAWVLLFALALYDTMADEWPYYVSLSLLAWNAFVASKAISTGDFKATHFPQLIAFPVMQSAAVLTDFAVHHKWLDPRFLASWYPFAILATARQLMIGVSDMLLGMGYNTPLNMIWRVLFDPSRGPHGAFSSRRQPTPFTFNFLLTIGSFVLCAFAGLFLEEFPDFTLYILTISVINLGPILLSLLFQGAPAFVIRDPHVVYWNMAPFVLMIYLTQYRNLARSPLWWAAFLGSLARRQLLDVAKAIVRHTLKPRLIYGLMDTPDGRKVMDPNQKVAPNPSFHKAVFRASNGAFLAQVSVALWAIVWIAAGTKYGAFPKMLSALNPVSWFLFLYYAVGTLFVTIRYTLVHVFMDLFMLPTALPRAIMLPFQLVSELGWIVEHMAEHLGTHWPSMLLALLVGIEIVLQFPLYMSRVVRASIQEWTSRLAYSAQQLLFVVPVSASPYVPALADYLGGTKSRLGVAVYVVWWALAIAGTLTHLALIREEFGDGTGVYEVTIDAMVSAMDIHTSVDVYGLMAAALGFVGRAILVFQIALAWEYDVNPWRTIRVEGDLHALSEVSHHLWWLPIAVVCIVAWSSLMLYQRITFGEIDTVGYLAIILAGLMPYLFPAMPDWLFVIWAFVVAWACVGALGLLVEEFAVRDAEDAPASKTIHAFITELKENQTWLVGALYALPALNIVMASPLGPRLFDSPHPKEIFTGDGSPILLALIAIGILCSAAMLLVVNVLARFYDVQRLPRALCSALAASYLVAIAVRWRFPDMELWAEVLWWIPGGATVGLGAFIVTVQWFGGLYQTKYEVEIHKGQYIEYLSHPFTLPFLQFLDGKDTRVPGQQDTKKVGGLRPILSKIVALSLAVAFPVCMWYLARDSWQETIELFQKEGLQDSLAFMGHLGWVGRVGQRLVAFFLDHMRQKHWTWVAVGCASFLAHLSFLMPALVSEFDHRWQQYLLLGCIAGNNAALLLAFAGEAPLRWLSGLILVAVAAAHVWNTAMEDPEADLFAGVVEHLISNAGQGFLTALQILLALHMFLGSTTGYAFSSTGLPHITPGVLILLVIYCYAVSIDPEDTDEDDSPERYQRSRKYHEQRPAYSVALGVLLLVIAYSGIPEGSTALKVALCLLCAALPAMTIVGQLRFKLDASAIFGGLGSDEDDDRTTIISTVAVLSLAYAVLGAAGIPDRYAPAALVPFVDATWHAAAIAAVALFVAYGAVMFRQSGGSLQSLKRLRQAHDEKSKFEAEGVAVEFLATAALLLVALATRDTATSPEVLWVVAWWVLAAGTVGLGLVSVLSAASHDLLRQAARHPDFSDKAAPALIAGAAALAASDVSGLTALAAPWLAAAVRPFATAAAWLAHMFHNAVNASLKPFYTAAVFVGLRLRTALDAVADWALRADAWSTRITDVFSAEHAQAIGDFVSRNLERVFGPVARWLAPAANAVLAMLKRLDFVTAWAASVGKAFAGAGQWLYGLGDYLGPLGIVLAPFKWLVQALSKLASSVGGALSSIGSFHHLAHHANEYMEVILHSAMHLVFRE